MSFENQEKKHRQRFFASMKGHPDHEKIREEQKNVRAKLAK